LVLGVDTRRQVSGTVVEEIIVKLTISRAELLIGKEKRVIEECEGVEDVEFGLWMDMSVILF
jgi:hypothetical protein